MGLTQKLGTIPLAIQTDSSNNVGIGTSTIGGKLDVRAAATSAFSYYFRNAAGGYGGGVYNTGSNNTQLYLATSAGTENILLNSSGASYFNGGNVGIGTNAPDRLLQISNTAGQAVFSVIAADNDSADIFLGDNANKAEAVIRFVNGSNDLRFLNGGTERMRINSSGYIKMSNTGDYLGAGTSYYEMLSTQNNADCFVVTHRGSSPFCLTLYYNNVTPNNTTNYFLNCQDPTNSKAFIYSNGTYGSRTGVYGSIISDEKYKTEIQPASSQWNDIKNLRVVNFKYKEDVELEGENALRQIGFIAQEVEAVSPNLVYEARDKDKEETWKSVKTSIIHLKAVKALQEAMERIEELEAKVTALENK